MYFYNTLFALDYNIWHVMYFYNTLFALDDMSSISIWQPTNDCQEHCGNCGFEERGMLGKVNHLFTQYLL